MYGTRMSVVCLQNFPEPEVEPRRPKLVKSITISHHHKSSRELSHARDILNVEISAPFSTKKKRKKEKKKIYDET